MNNNNEKQTWWQRNKKKALIIGGVVVAVGIGYIIIKNKDTICNLIRQTGTIPNKSNSNPDSPIIERLSAESITSHCPINNGEPFGVSGHIRNLADGQHPSDKKIAEAASLGITLGHNQTLVDTYMKNVA